MGERSPAAVAIGLVYVAVGVLSLLAAFDMWRPPLAVVGPLVVVAIGFTFVLGGLRRRALRRPGPRHMS